MAIVNLDYVAERAGLFGQNTDGAQLQSPRQGDQQIEVSSYVIPNTLHSSPEQSISDSEGWRIQGDETAKDFVEKNLAALNRDLEDVSERGSRKSIEIEFLRPVKGSPSESKVISYNQDHQTFYTHAAYPDNQYSSAVTQISDLSPNAQKFFRRADQILANNKKFSEIGSRIAA